MLYFWMFLFISFWTIRATRVGQNDITRRSIYEQGINAPIEVLFDTVYRGEFQLIIVSFKKQAQTK